MKKTFGKSNRKASYLTGKPTSSQVSADGRSLSPSLDGIDESQFGQDLAPVRLSAWLEKKRNARIVERVLSHALAELDTSSALIANMPGKQMKGISGQSSTVSSATRDLQWFLESRLRAMVVLSGSPEYGLLWKPSAIVLGPAICLLRASPLLISGRGYSGSQKGLLSLLENPPSGWGTPTARDWKDGKSKLKDNKSLLGQQVLGWPTPEHRNSEGYQVANGKKYLRLGAVAKLSTSETAADGELNPELSRWLMGFPIEWGRYAPMEMPSSRK